MLLRPNAQCIEARGRIFADCGNDCGFSLDRRGELAYNDKENTKGGERE